MPRPVRIMGVVNTTPDSFSDGGRFRDAEAAIAHGRRLFEAGADILDVGGESTRPGATPVSLEEERGRVLPVIAALAAGTTGSPIVSIDTYKAGVAEAAIAAGAQIVNDVSGGLLDPALLEVVARDGATVILGHLRGTPATMESEARYGDVVGEVRDELGARVAAARAAGIPDGRIWIDPGLGFAKRPEHSLALLAHLDALAALGCPIAIGASRKRFLGASSGTPGAPRGDSVIAREEATAAAHALAIVRGAEVVRVHDVARQRAAIRLAEAVRDLMV
jgi:dihydropteroate synthase